MNRGGGIARALGGASTRRKRHRRFAVGAGALLVVAALLAVFGGGDDGGDPTTSEAAASICRTFTTRLQHEFQLSFPEGIPTADAQAEYLSHAFADTLDELVGELQAIAPTGDLDFAVGQLAGLAASLRADPSTGIGVDPFSAGVRAAFDDAGVPDCGSGFLGAAE